MANSKVLQFILKVVGGKQAAQEFKSLNGTLGQFADIAGGLVGGAIAYKLADGVLQFGVESARAAIKAERLGVATTNLAKGLGLTADALVEGIQQASGGTIDKLTALEAANKAMMFGVIDSQAEMSKLAEVATVLGAAMGQDAATSINDLTTALGRQSPLILDNLGLLTDVEGWQRQYADSLGKTVAQLTEAEKKQAFVNGALAEAARKADELGGIAPTAATGIDRLSAAWKDLKTTVGKNSTGPLAEGADWLAGVIEQINNGLDGSTRIEDIDAEIAMLQNRIAQREKDNAQLFAEKIKADKAHIRLLQREKAALTGIVSKYRDELGPAQRARLDAERSVTGELQLQNIEISRGANAYAARLTAMAEQLYGISAVDMPTGFDRTMLDQYFTQPLTDSFADAADELSNIVQNVMQPTLAEVWQPANGEQQRIDEWARRAATIMTNGLGSEWIPALKEQFGGTDFWQPIQDALDSGDIGTAQNLLGELLTKNPEKLWDKELIKQKVRDSITEQNLRQELIDTITSELQGEGLNVNAGDVSAQMGGAAALAGQTVGGMTDALPDAMKASATDAVLLGSLAQHIKDNKTDTLLLARTLVQGMNSHLQDVVGEFKLVKAITENVINELGLTPVRP